MQDVTELDSYLNGIIIISIIINSVKIALLYFATVIKGNQNESQPSFHNEIRGNTLFVSLSVASTFS